MAEGVRLADRLEAEPEGTPFCSQISVLRQPESSARKRRWRLLFRRLKCQPSDGSRSLSNGLGDSKLSKSFSWLVLRRGGWPIILGELGKGICSVSGMTLDDISVALMSAVRSSDLLGQVKELMISVEPDQM